MKNSIFKLFKNKIQCRSNEILNKIKHNGIQKTHIFYFILGLGVSIFQGKAFAYNKNVGFTSHPETAQCAGNVHSHKEKIHQLSLNNTSKYQNRTYFNQDFLKKFSDKSSLFF